MSLNTRDALTEFAKSGDEAAYRRVVDEFGSLVLRNAFRRTNDQTLAEEITQNVFAIMARKANRVAKHSSIAGWVFTTTRLESAKALRGRQRHRRKLAALTEELNKAPEMNAEDLEQWRDALPHLEEGLDKLPDADREALLARFFENKTFGQIASDTGKSKAACKMRVKRALDKLNGWMNRRGVTFSAAALSTALGTEWATAAPALVAQSISSSAVAAAPAVATSTILTNTLLTMNAMKTAGLAAAGILALGSVPMAIQHSQAESLRGEVIELRQQAEGISSTQKTVRLSGGLDRIGNGGLTPARRFLANAKMPPDAAQFVDQLVTAMMQNDMVATLKAFIPLSKLTPAELDQLIADVKAQDSNPAGKQLALPLLISMAAKESSDPGAVLEEALADGVSLQPMLGEIIGWTLKDPQAALAWYRRALDEGILEGKGIENSAQAGILQGLMLGLAATDPVAARDFLDEVDSESRDQMQSTLLGATIFGNEAGKQIARELLYEYENPEQRLHAFVRAASSGSSRKPLDQSAKIAAEMGFEGAHYSSALGAIASGHPNLPFEEQANWVAARMVDGHVDGISTLIQRQSSRGGETIGLITAWIDGLENGPIRDAALSAEVDRSMTFERNHEPVALRRADLISDPAIRAEAAKRALARWKMRDREAALSEAAKRGIELPN